jgi:hypothetical protein
MIDRAQVLAEDPLRCQSLPHMTLAGWDVLEFIMETKARDYPHWFTLERDGHRWRWINRPLGIDHSFTFLDESTLPYGPFEYITRQTQGDWTLQDGRDGTLWMDAGIATSQADWSVDFDVGMNFHEWHAPVPIAHDLGVFDRALKFLLKLQHGAPGPRLGQRVVAGHMLELAAQAFGGQQHGANRQHLHRHGVHLGRVGNRNRANSTIFCSQNLGHEGLLQL